jgi:hypothetical protein
MLTTDDIEHVIVNVVLNGVLDVRAGGPINATMIIHNVHYVSSRISANHLYVFRTVEIPQRFVDAAIERTRQRVVANRSGKIGRILLMLEAVFTDLVSPSA